MTVKPYRQIPIVECGESLVAIPTAPFAFFSPHPYVALGAPYGATSPWMLREKVLARLVNAQTELTRLKPGWKIRLFDAYRPNKVQIFLVERELGLVAAKAGLNATSLTKEQRESLLPQVYRLFAIPSEDPATPAPHSTGAALDCTLQDENGNEIDMGSPVDENSERSFPNHYADTNPQAHANRGFLRDVMASTGFIRNPSEWWHFSQGDQLAIWAEYGLTKGKVARYGRV